ncbi:hypothetical protein QJQ58_06910 [Paenibacillus dendritiformis]|uniref:hypothetical protein n=1 Tax=Paenibacillus dendritiformis TaxID=130049 RepID=UPI00105A0836|nr:hypothetical protein [Paenibacillus dendritiformis]TDL48132.1 hypothetical protein E2R60_27310 [Paenibacillus dendritiformis]WGU95983.1 hypothetical protein QJQ58_06910 [Paenibacillus dendritiformis]
MKNCETGPGQAFIIFHISFIRASEKVAIVVLYLNGQGIATALRHLTISRKNGSLLIAIMLFLIIAGMLAIVTIGSVG